MGKKEDDEAFMDKAGSDQTGPDQRNALAQPWSTRPRPCREALQGRYVRLEPLSASRHGKDLFAASMAPGSEDRFRYLFETVQEWPHFLRWLEACEASEDPLFFAVVDGENERCEGRQALMRIVPEHGVIEIGGILWGPGLAGTRKATESLYLIAQHVFERLGYRRLEWKCHAGNQASQRAARRFGFQFEGVFRQHMVLKGQNRDTTWFSMLDSDWPRLSMEFTRWLAPENFDAGGKQRTPLRHEAAEVSGLSV